ncbi:hypothetical protein JCM8208_007419 [Rhodotorula glutinis]
MVSPRRKATSCSMSTGSPRRRSARIQARTSSPAPSSPVVASSRAFQHATAAAPMPRSILVRTSSSSTLTSALTASARVGVKAVRFALQLEEGRSGGLDGVENSKADSGVAAAVEAEEAGDKGAAQDKSVVEASSEGFEDACSASVDEADSVLGVPGAWIW